MKANIGQTDLGREGAFTLVELLTATGILSLLVLATLSVHLLGLRMFNIAATKVSASANARTALNQLRDEIRSGKTLHVGTGNSTAFTNSLQDSPRRGNALQIYPGTSTNVFVRYYLDPATQQLNRVASGSAQVTVVARYITNQMPFAVEDCAGNVVTNDQNNRVIGMTLSFYQWEFPVARAGADDYYDRFLVHTRMTRRAIE